MIYFLHLTKHLEMLTLVNKIKLFTSGNISCQKKKKKIYYLKNYIIDYITKFYLSKGISLCY